MEEDPDITGDIEPVLERACRQGKKPGKRAINPDFAIGQSAADARRSG